MNFDDLNKIESNPAFSNLATVELNERNYFLAGTEGVAELESATYIDGHMGQSVVFKYTVVQCQAVREGVTVYPPGTSVASVCKLNLPEGPGKVLADKARMAKERLLKEILALAGLRFADKNLPQEKLATYATSAAQPFYKCRIGWKSVPSKKDPSKLYVQWEPLPEENTPEKLEERRS